MSDYIKREDAITELRKRVHRFTVADEIGYTGTVKWSEEVIYETSAMNGLMSIPAADVVEISKIEKWVDGIVEMRDRYHKGTHDYEELDNLAFQILTMLEFITEGRESRATDERDVYLLR